MGTTAFSADDERHMRRALELAKRGMGFTSPNPMVGAVVVKGGRVIGEGYHERYGQLHAERNALASCSESPEGATIYVTLEPCCHYGKTPPCTQAIIDAGIARVVMASSDPNPLVAGKGIGPMRQAGISVEGNLLEDEALRLNEPFFHFISTGRPLVVLKYAMTLDGKIATRTGESKWVTGEQARADVQLDRLRYSSIMVGIGTVEADDPLLTCRIEPDASPLRVVCDGGLSISLGSQLVRTAGEPPTVVATLQPQDCEKARALEGAGCRVWQVPPDANGRVDAGEVFRRLGGEGIDSVYVEGGAALAASIVEQRLADKVKAYIAPKLFGGAGAASPIGGLGVAEPSQCATLEDVQTRRVGDDLLVEGKVRYCSRG